MIAGHEYPCILECGCHGVICSPAAGAGNIPWFASMENPFAKLFPDGKPSESGHMLDVNQHTMTTPVKVTIHIFEYSSFAM
jgi:hypothetical protein